MTAVQIVPDEGGNYTATVNGTPILISGYLAENGDNGKVVVSLLISADALQIGIPPRRTPDSLEQTRAMTAPRGVWGDPGTPDPRQNMPGWTPPPVGADAGRGQTGEYPPVASHRRKP